MKPKIKISKIVKILIISCIGISLLITFIIIILSNFKHNINKNKDIVYNVVPNITLPLGNKIPSIDVFFKEKGVEGKIKIYYNDWLVESSTLNEPGIYKAIISTENGDYTSTITVNDNEAPKLKLKNLIIRPNDNYEESSFVESCKDNSNKSCNLSFSKKEMENYKEEGTYDIKIVATDYSLNKTDSTAKLTITSDKKIKTNLVKTSKKENSKIEENVTETKKYGVKIKTTESTYYEVSDDGENKKLRSKVLNEYNRDNYKASTKELLNDSKEILKDNEEIINAFLEKINKIREEETIEPLVLSDKLNEAATIRSLEIAWSGIYSHTRPNGKSVSSINEELGYNNKILAESLVKNQKTAATAINYLKVSTGSYKNMTNPSYKYIGVGKVVENETYYWVILYSNSD